MAPVELQMDCYGCAKNISKALRKVPGVEDVEWSMKSHRVWVYGTANAQELKARIETKMRRSVKIISDGVEPPPPQSRRVASPPPPPPASPASPPRYRPPTSPPNYVPPTSPPNYPPPPPPRSGYGYYDQYGGNGNGDYYDQYRGNGNYYDQYGGNPYDQYGGNDNGNYYDHQYRGNGNPYDDQYGGNSNGNYYDQYRANYENYVGHPRGPHYMPNDAPDFFSDENPNACSIQ